MNIEKILSKLPSEAYSQIINTYCIDQDKNPSELTLDEVVTEVEWTIERMKMDIADGHDPAIAKKTIAACQKFLKKYKV